MKLKIPFISFSFCFYIMPSYVLHSYIGIDFKLLFILSIIPCIIILITYNYFKITSVLNLVNISLIFLGVIGSLVSGSNSQILLLGTFSICLSFAITTWIFFLDSKILLKINYLCMIILVGAVIGFLYALSGGQPLSSVFLYGSSFPRETYLYLTTFTDVTFDRVIRPAGLFDEPGALAFFSCIVVSLNEIFKVNKLLSISILVLSLITGSLALVIILIIFLTLNFSFKSYSKFLVLAVTILLLFVLIIGFENAENLFDIFFGSRFEIVDGRLAGDNRTSQIDTFFEVVNLSDIYYGNNTLQQIRTLDYDISSNPFSILYYYGIFAWVPYLVIMSWLLYTSFYYNRIVKFSSLTLFILLLQRPYIYNLYWTPMICLVLCSIFFINKNYNMPKKAYI